ncbi:glycosyltransferase family 39 protein [Halapricum salinum]|uniref:Phospholipid carrier-dependent glycosyltransferase n=1 Tax=Halapricum salinum TaxID=1457250 RepID=A0A4D6HBI9_9EURY|nr:glycosyltransferase family 39 protein [Halapricum salinum]QCC51299.1 phospholipid carrier-dependent glycosyltransferase [Halapricum salinum]
MWLPSPLERASDQFREDLAADPYLKYILLVSAVLATFWIWHRLPNFATRDERWRVVDSMEVAGFVADDGLTLEALQDGTSYWRVFGPTLYLYGLVALPAIVLTFAIGDGHVFSDLLGALGTDFYAHWQAIPAWLWWATVLPARLVNALLAVGCVYLLYRIGTKLRDRATGRLAALLLALTWGLIFLGHEAGEDVPALFCILLAFYLAIRYVETGSRRLFLWGSAVGGLAIAFKPTAGITAVMLGMAYLLHARRADDPVRALARPGVLIGGPVVALAVMYLAFPSVVLNGHEVLLDRLDRVANEKTNSHGWLGRPAWWWYVRGTVNGLGWPLAIACLGGVVAAVGGLGRRVLPPALARLRGQSSADSDPSLETDGMVLALAGIVVMTAVFSTWAYFRTHHLLPMFPLAIVLVALALRWLADSPRTVGAVDAHRLFQGVTAVLLVTTAIYAGVGTVGYATQPRDQAVSWLIEHGGENATVETYSGDSQEAAVPHGWTIYRPTDGTRGMVLANWMRLIEHRCPDYVVLNYQRSMLWLAPENHSQLADRWARPGVPTFLESLLSANGAYPYEVAERFGPQPPFRDGGEPFDPTWDMVRAGIYPRTIQYGDPQDFGVYGYAVVLERTGACDGSN